MSMLPSLLRLTALSGLAGLAAAAAAEGSDYDATVQGPHDQPMLGIEMSPVPSPVLTSDGLTPNQGVYVQNTFNNTAAQSMGIQPGDVVLGVNGSPISSMSDLRNEIGMNQVGDPVQVTVDRNGQEMSLSAPLQAWPAEIPHESIDPQAEQRFRDWQAQRQKQEQDQANDLADQVQQLDQQMPTRDAASQARLDALASALYQADGSIRPWLLAFHLVKPAAGPAGPAPAALPAGAAPAPAATGAPALRLVWTSRNAEQAAAATRAAGADR